MINFYLTTPWCFANKPIFLAEFEASRAASDRSTHTRHVLESTVLPYRYCRSKGPKALDEFREVASKAIEALSQVVPTVVGQPVLFGTWGDLMRPGSVFPETEHRFERLGENFESTVWVVHLPTTNQIFAIRRLKGVESRRELHVIREGRLSWFNFVWPLCCLAGNCFLTFWNSWRPNATDFLCRVRCAGWSI